MTLLSLFMTSTGVFCFVPISHRLIESGIVPASNDWRLPFVFAPTKLYDRNDVLLAADKAKNAWPRNDEGRRVYSAQDTRVTDQLPAMPWSPVIVSPPAHSISQSTSTDACYGREFTSVTSVTQHSSLCDSCNTLLRREIPPDHIPSVVRALALFEAQDRLSDVGFNEYEVAALTNAFSMLQL